MSNETPASIIAELRRIGSESAKGPQAVYDAEVAVASLEQAYDREISLALINSPGTVDEKKAHAKIAASDVKFQLDLAKASLNRVRLKVKQLESAQVATSVIAKLMESEMRLGR